MQAGGKAPAQLRQAGAGLSLGTTGGSCFPEQSAGVGKEPKLQEAGAAHGAHSGDFLHAEAGQNFEPESDVTGSGDQGVPALSRLYRREGQELGQGDQEKEEWHFQSPCGLFLLLLLLLKLKAFIFKVVCTV